MATKKWEVWGYIGSFPYGDGDWGAIHHVCLDRNAELKLGWILEKRWEVVLNYLKSNSFIHQTCKVKDLEWEWLDHEEILFVSIKNHTKAKGCPLFEISEVER